MDKLYVQQYGQLEKLHWWFIIRREIILQKLRKFIPVHQPGHLKILNTGAAAGGSSQWLSTLGETLSLENDPLFVSYLEDQHLTVINSSVTAIPLADHSFNLVCAFDVIEHIENDAKAIEELIRVCKPGGIICITVPAFNFLWSNHDVVNGHHRRYLKRKLKAMIDGQQATVVYCSYFNTLLFFPIFALRKMQCLLGSRLRRNESDFNYFKKNNFLNKVLKGVFGMELFLLRMMKFPFGVSLIMLVRKNFAHHEESYTQQGK